MLFASALVGALFAANSLAHMQLDYPAPFNASNNPNRATDTYDEYLQFPYDNAGPNARWLYPCRGYEKLIGTPEGAPTATWEAGSTQKWTIAGIGNHFGGSCQVGFSTDEGKTFRVATSYEGNCPHRNNGNGPEGQGFDVKVPSDIEPGVHIFAWVWYNREQELNMNCAAVNITSSSVTNGYSSTASTRPVFKTSNGCTCHGISPADISTCDCDCPASCSGKIARSADSSSVAFNDRPLMFIADDGNDCVTPHTTAELRYPDPGPDVVSGDGAYPLELPTGKCAQSQMLLKQAYHGESGNDGHA